MDQLMLVLVLVVPLICALNIKTLEENACVISYLKIKGFVIENFTGSKTLPVSECEALVKHQKKIIHDEFVAVIRDDHEFSGLENCILEKMEKMEYQDLYLLTSVYKGPGFDGILKEQTLKEIKANVTHNTLRFKAACRPSIFDIYFYSLLTSIYNNDLNGRQKYCLRMKVNDEKLLPVFLDANPNNFDTSGIDCSFEFLSVNSKIEMLALSAVQFILGSSTDNAKKYCVQRVIRDENYVDSIIEHLFVREVELNETAEKLLREKFVETMRVTLDNVQKCYF